MSELTNTPAPAEVTNTGFLSALSRQSAGVAIELEGVTKNYAGRWLAEAPERTVETVRWLNDKYGVNGLEFHDSNFFTAEKRVAAFADVGVVRDRIELVRADAGRDVGTDLVPPPDLGVRRQKGHQRGRHGH